MIRVILSIIVVTQYKMITSFLWLLGKNFYLEHNLKELSLAKKC